MGIPALGTPTALRHNGSQTAGVSFSCDVSVLSASHGTMGIVNCHGKRKIRFNSKNKVKYRRFRSKRKTHASVCIYHIGCYPSTYRLFIYLPTYLPVYLMKRVHRTERRDAHQRLYRSHVSDAERQQEGELKPGRNFPTSERRTNQDAGVLFWNNLVWKSL